jgi:tetratricopeptide (TPR) repeat protein
MKNTTLIALLSLGTPALATAGVPPSSPRPHAQARKPAPKAKAAAPAAAPAADEPATGGAGGGDAAQKHSDAGDAHFKAGRYDRALAEYQAADRAESTPDRKVQIGHALEKLGRASEALANYRLAASSPDPFASDEAKKRIAVLEKAGGGGDNSAEMGADPFAEAPAEDKKATAAPAEEAPAAAAPASARKPPARGKKKK